ncbi:hypothetical protein TNCT_21491 [Trichonephila clavata]|uniref:Uncharacterized protein n=1 Tax=Trichonephila clavata TaxID=2740835 RepID=A0A8X6J7P6_TRICU|nr:hypothetical protein TNCT_21491 [Trichonephila clavata]
MVSLRVHKFYSGQFYSGQTEKDLSDPRCRPPQWIPSHDNIRELWNTTERPLVSTFRYLRLLPGRKRISRSERN